MKKEVTVGQLISVVVGVITALVSFWLTLRSDVDVLKHNDKVPNQLSQKKLATYP